MSLWMDGFTELGPYFVKDYKKGHTGSLEGFGRALAVATFIYDFDCIGNTGGNMGFIQENGHKVIMKIDAGEALPFLTDMSLSPGTVHNAQSKDMIVGTDGTKIAFEQLTKKDQKEFVRASSQILMIGDEKIKDVFREFIKEDKRFEVIQKDLLKRKKDFLSAFSPEVRKLIE